MKLKVKIVFLSLFGVFITSCSGKSVDQDINPDFTIKRFDQALYHYLSGKPNSDLAEYQTLLNELGANVLHIGDVDSIGFYHRLQSYFREATLRQLYADEQNRFIDIDSINRELSYGMEELLMHFPSIPRPVIYMHVSGLMQNVIVNDSILSLSADKYLGADYPLYQRFFEDYRRELMTEERMVPDYLLGYLMANLPFRGEEGVLLDRMLYEGKLRYILSRLIPERADWEYVAYKQEQYQWCEDHEKLIWKQVLENKHLFTSNLVVTDKYLKESPYTTYLPVESPGRVGVWLGFRIVRSFMKQHPKTSLSELMDITDYQYLLKESKYKP